MVYNTMHVIQVIQINRTNIKRNKKRERRKKEENSNYVIYNLCINVYNLAVVK